MTDNSKTTDQPDKRNGGSRFIFQLFIAGHTPISIRATLNIKSILEEYYADRYSLDVFDIYEYPGLAVTEEVLAVPFLVRKQPLPELRMIGDFSDRQKVIHELMISTK